MQDKVKEILKRFSFVTNQPESDWPKLFLCLVLIGIVSLVWNIYFYFAVQADIAASENSSRTRAAAIATKEDEIREVIQTFEDKKANQTKLLESKSYKLEDPSVL